MAPINNKDEEAISRAHRERIERMRREKQLQEERRRKVMQILPIVVSALCLLILLTVLMVVVVDKPLGKAVQPTEGVEMQIASMEKNTVEEEEIQIVETKESEEAETPEMTPAETEALFVQEQEEITPTYTFEETNNTAYIFAEEVMSTHAVLINESTDTVVAVKGAHDRISPASMTKVLTVLVAAEHINEEELDNTFTMTKEITDYAYVNDCSSVGFLDGEEVTVRDLFYGTVLPSGGDAAVALATYVAGSHEAFVEMMNDKLEEMGLAESAHFTNCAGLYDDNHYCTVYDMAIIMKAAVENERCKEFLSLHTYTTTATEQHPEGITISNWFLRRIEDKDTGGEVICAKTGYVTESGSCAVSYATCADGAPYICVTLGAHSGWRCIYDHVEIYNRYVQTGVESE